MIEDFPIVSSSQRRSKAKEGQTYFAAMAAAANFAFNNRQQILAGVRQAFHQVLKADPRKVRLLYDVCHNIAQIRRT